MPNLSSLFTKFLFRETLTTEEKAFIRGDIEAGVPETTESVLALQTGLAVSGSTSGTLTLAAAGKAILATGDVHIPDETFAAGNVITISNITSSAITITSDLTLRIAGTTDAGDIQLAAYGLASILIESSSAAKITGEGIALDLDADAVTFFTAASITDSGVKSAVSTLVTDLKTASIWSKMLAVYPFVQNPGGSSTVPHSFNLKNPAAYQIAWTGGFIASDLGIQGNGGYGNTGLALNTTTPNSLAFGCYNRVLGAIQGGFGMCANNGSDGAWLGTVYDSTNAYFDNQLNGGAGRCSGTVSNSTGLYVSSRTASNSHKGYKQGVEIASTTGAQGTLVSNNFHLFTNYAHNAAASATGGNLGFAFISSGLTGAEVAELYTTVQAFNTALGRAV